MEYGPDDRIRLSIPDAPYVQLAAILRARIRRGDWPEGRVSENQLAAHFELSRPTVRRAIALLAVEGWLMVVPRRGTFIVSRQESTSTADGSGGQDAGA